MKNLELVVGLCSAYDMFDLDKVCEFVHPEIKVISLISNKFNVQGILEFRAFYGEAFRKFPNQKTILKNRLVFGDSVIDEEVILGRDSNSDGVHGFVIYAFRDGLIDRIWI